MTVDIRELFCDSLIFQQDTERAEEGTDNREFPIGTPNRCTINQEFTEYS